MILPAVDHIQAISDTGPLISIFQSNSLEVIIPLIPVFHITPVCKQELSKHGWDHALRAAAETIEIHTLTASEDHLAYTIAEQIARHPESNDPIPDNHLGEAQTMTLATRPEFINGLLLLDEKVARMVAKNMGFTISGFPGILLEAVDENLLTAEELRAKLMTCKRLGTHYSDTLIEQVYRTARRIK